MSNVYQNWHLDFFEDDRIISLYQQRELPSIDFFKKFLNIENLLNLRVFDQCCGNGRIAKLFSDEGSITYGCDLSPKAIITAKNQHGQRNLVVADAKLYIPEEACDIALNFYSSFPYDIEDSENEKIISKLAQSLKPKGKLLMELMNSEDVIGNFQPEFVFGDFIRKARIENQVMYQDWYHNGSFLKNSCIKMYSQQELRTMISKYFTEVNITVHDKRLVITAIKT